MAEINGGAVALWTVVSIVHALVMSLVVYLILRKKLQAKKLWIITIAFFFGELVLTMTPLFLALATS
jgi:hypothetical protein